MIVNKKQSIVQAAERLFAMQGYDHTSTQLIAKEAGVSEALIFKHFGSKEKLLEHIIKTGYRRIVLANRGMLLRQEPVDFISNILDLPAKLVAEEPDFWGLQYRLNDLPLSVAEHSRFLQPLHNMLVETFRNLGFDAPEDETMLLLLIVDAIWKKEVLQGSNTTKAIRDLMKKKYHPFK